MIPQGAACPSSAAFRLTLEAAQSPRPPASRSPLPGLPRMLRPAWGRCPDLSGGTRLSHLHYGHASPASTRTHSFIHSFIQPLTQQTSQQQVQQARAVRARDCPQDGRARAHALGPRAARPRSLPAACGRRGWDSLSQGKT